MWRNYQFRRVSFLIFRKLSKNSFSAAWHQYEIWKQAREARPNLSSTNAELSVLYECNRDYLRRLDFNLENGKYGLRKSFNRHVFNALSIAFSETNSKLQGI